MDRTSDELYMAYKRVIWAERAVNRSDRTTGNAPQHEIEDLAEAKANLDRARRDDTFTQKPQLVVVIDPARMGKLFDEEGKLRNE